MTWREDSKLNAGCMLSIPMMAVTTQAVVSIGLDVSELT
jgi:hypothetical protein